MRYYCPDKLRTWPNGAASFGIDGAMYSEVGQFGKVANCPIQGTSLRYTCYATSGPDTFFSVPACVKIHGKHVSGFFTCSEDGPEFVPYARFDAFLSTIH